MSSITVFTVTDSPRGEELGRLFQEHYGLVFRTAYSVTGSVEDAEDVLQNVFASLLRRELPPELHKNPRAYFYRAAFNLSLNTVRYRKRHPSASGERLLLSEVRAADTLHDEELEARLREAIAELHPTSAEILILKYVHHRSLAEIAKLLGTTRSTVAVSLFRSRAKLKKRIRSEWEKKS